MNGRDIPHLVICLIGLLTADTLAAEGTIHVAPRGQTRAAGTQADPLGSLAQALDRAIPGDTIRLAPGVYREGEIRLKGGRPDQPITLQGDPGGGSIIKGSQRVVDWERLDDGTWRRDNWPVNSQQLLINGKPMQQVGAGSPWHQRKWSDKPILKRVGHARADLSAGQFYYDAQRRILWCMPPSDENLNKARVEASTASTILIGWGASHIVLRDLTFMHCNGTADGDWSALIRSDGSQWTIERCTFAWSDMAGLALNGDGHRIRDCRFMNNGQLGLGYNASNHGHDWGWYYDRELCDVLIDHCQFVGNNYRGFEPSWAAGGIKIIPSARGVTVRDCHVIRNAGHGIWFDTSFGSNVVEDNVVVANQVGIHYELSFPHADDPFGCLIRNNRVAHSSNHGIYISAARGAIVENNTCYKNRFSIVVHGMPRVFERYEQRFGKPLKLGDNVVRNNIVYGVYSDLILWTGERSGENASNGNFYADVNADDQEPIPGDPVVRIGLVTDVGYDLTHFALNKLRAETALEADGQAGDPLWVNPQALDFTLQQASPAKGKGWQPSKTDAANDPPGP